MSAREDVRTFLSLPIEFSSIELEPCPDAEPYFCTPAGTEIDVPQPRPGTVPALPGTFGIQPQDH